MPGINATVSTAGRRRLIDKFSFRLKSPLIKDVGFVTASELKVSTEVIRYRAGGSLIPVKNPGLADFDPFTVTRAATTEVEDLYAWQQLTLRAAEGGPGGARGRGECEASQYKCYIEVVATNRCHAPIKRWRLEGCWPSEFSAADGFDNNASEHVFESMTFEYDYFVKVDARTGDFFSFSLAGVFGGFNVGGLADSLGFSRATAAFSG